VALIGVAGNVPAAAKTPGPTSVNNGATRGCSPAWQRRHEPPLGELEEHQEMETAYTRTGVAGVGGGVAGPAASCYPAG
jgi:hypothetical protein